MFVFYYDVVLETPSTLKLYSCVVEMKIKAEFDYGSNPSKGAGIRERAH